MDHPPFRAALLSSAAAWVGERDIPFGDGRRDEPPAADATNAQPSRLRLGEMDMHLHCSVIGTCLSTSDLRRLMAKFIHVADLSDLDVHHEAVRMASQDHEAARALHKALDRRHDATVQRFAKVKDLQVLGDLWQQALDSGEVPGAYWAVLTHRRATPELRQRVFGDVHMLSHLVGAANRADIRRLVALERENAELRERAERQQERVAALIGERDLERSARAAAESRCGLLTSRLAAVSERGADAAAVEGAQAALAREVAVQTRRREDAENHARALAAELERLQAEREELREHAATLARELVAAEGELRACSSGAPDASSALTAALRGRKVLYVGGRPSSSTAIRDLVLRHGGEFQRHDGGIEDRKGLLGAALSWSALVAFPVDCIDHDSALVLKRSCLRQSVPFLALRSASVASFAAAVEAWARPAEASGCRSDGPCLRHG